MEGAASPRPRCPSSAVSRSATFCEVAKTRRASPSADAVEPLRPDGAVRGRAATPRIGRARCGRARMPGGTGGAARRPCSGAARNTTGTSSRSPCRWPAVRLREVGSRQRNAWLRTRAPGYHLNGSVTTSASWPRRGARGEVVSEDLGAAARERHLRTADGDPHGVASDDRVVERPEQQLVQPAHVPGDRAGRRAPPAAPLARSGI